MPVSEQMPVADVKNRVDDLESLEETLDVMDSAALPNDIRESLAELGKADGPEAADHGRIDDFPGRVTIAWRPLEV
jgi:hypothetical protein